MVAQWSDYIVYVDESGDHSFTRYPVFVLAFCIFHKRHHGDMVTPAITDFNFHQFGHDMQILHETDIRKEKKSFNCPYQVWQMSWAANRSQTKLRGASPKPLAVITLLPHDNLSIRRRI